MAESTGMSTGRRGMKIAGLLLAIPLVAIAMLVALAGFGAIFKVAVPVTYLAKPVTALLLPDNISLDPNSVTLRPGSVTSVALRDTRLQYTGPYHPDLDLLIGELDFNLSIDSLLRGDILV